MPRGDTAGGKLPGGFGGRSGAGVRGGKIGTPSPPHSVDKGREGTRGITTLGLGGGTGTPGSCGDTTTLVCSSVFLVAAFHANLLSEEKKEVWVFLGEVVGEMVSNFSMRDDTLRFVCVVLGVVSEVGVLTSVFSPILLLSIKLSVLFERRLISTLFAIIAGIVSSPLGLPSSSSEISSFSSHPSVGRGGLGGAVRFLGGISPESDPAISPPLTIEAVRGGIGGMEKAPSSSESLSDESTQSKNSVLDRDPHRTHTHHCHPACYFP